MPNNTNETSNGNGKHRIAVKSEISLGNILTITSIIIAFAISWGQISTRLTILADEIVNIKAAEARHEDDIRVHYMINSPAEARLEEIKSLVLQMNSKIDEHMKEK